MMKADVKQAKLSFLRVYWKVVLALYAVEFSLLLLWSAGLLGNACRFNGSAMEQCFLFGMNIDELADSFISFWMIPLIGPLLGLGAPLLAAIWPSVFLWVVLVMVQKARQEKTPAVSDMPAETPTVQRREE